MKKDNKNHFISPKMFEETIEILEKNLLIDRQI